MLTRLFRIHALGLVAALATAGACKFTISDPSQGNQGLTSLLVSAEVDTADGVRVDTITATIDTAFRGTNTVVDFATSASSFSTGPAIATLSVKPDSSGVARAFLRAPTDRTVAVVSATAGGVTRTRRIEFVPAEPSRLTVTSTQYVLKAQPGVAFAEITAALSRTRGSVTPGGTIQFEAVTPSADFVELSVKSATATVAGATTRVFPLTGAAGNVTLRVTYTRGPLTLRDSVLIRIIP